MKRDTLLNILLLYVSFSGRSAMGAAISSVDHDQLETPVLLVIFNRSDKQQKVFDRIRQVRPKQLFIAADGPRDRVADDKKKCDDARKIIQQVDWPCELKTLIREKNSGGDEPGVAGAIDWFFEHVSEGIIFEDDCVPDPSFFYFCQELLARYRDNRNVFSICGLRLGDDPLKAKNGASIYSYYFTKPHIFHWGWATWSRAWRTYDRLMTQFDEFKTKGLDKVVYPHNTRLRGHNMGIWSSSRGRLKSNKNYNSLWDVRFSFAEAVANALTIFPTVNLVENIGFDASAINTKSGRAEWKQKAVSIDYKHLNHPPAVVAYD